LSGAFLIYNALFPLLFSPIFSEFTIREIQERKEGRAAFNRRHKCVVYAEDVNLLNKA
jgi:hypothetical protein